MGKICTICKSDLPLSQYYRDAHIKSDGLMACCKQCSNERRKRYNWKSKNKCKEYHRNFKGYAFSIYRRMITRNKHNPKYKSRSVEIGRDEFMEWILNNPDYLKCYNDWVDSGFVVKMSPSIDRVNNSLGYLRGNIQIIPQFMNCRKGAS